MLWVALLATLIVVLATVALGLAIDIAITMVLSEKLHHLLMMKYLSWSVCVMFMGVWVWCLTELGIYLLKKSNTKKFTNEEIMISRDSSYKLMIIWIIGTAVVGILAYLL